MSNYIPKHRAHIPKHRAEQPHSLGPIEGDIYAHIRAAGRLGIATDNLRYRTGQNPSMLWGALWSLRSAGLVHIICEHDGFRAYTTA